MAFSLYRLWHSPLRPVKGAVLNRFREVFSRNRLCPSQVCNGPRHFANAVVRPRTQPIVPHGLLQQALASAIESAELADLAHAHGGIMRHRRAGKTRPLTGASGIDAGANRCRRLRRRGRSQVGIMYGWDIHMNINAVE